MSNKKAGLLKLKVNGKTLRTAGDFTYGIGTVKKEALIGTDGVHGYKEVPQVSFIEGDIRDGLNIDLKELSEADIESATLELGNKKIIILSDGWVASELTGSTGEATIPLRIEAKKAKEVS